MEKYTTDNTLILVSHFLSLFLFFPLQFKISYATNVIAIAISLVIRVPWVYFFVFEKSFFND